MTFVIRSDALGPERISSVYYRGRIAPEDVATWTPNLDGAKTFESREEAFKFAGEQALAIRYGSYRVVEKAKEATRR